MKAGKTLQALRNNIANAKSLADSLGTENDSAAMQHIELLQNDLMKALANSQTLADGCSISPGEPGQCVSDRKYVEIGFPKQGTSVIRLRSELFGIPVPKTSMHRSEAVKKLLRTRVMRELEEFTATHETPYFEVRRFICFVHICSGYVALDADNLVHKFVTDILYPFFMPDDGENLVRIFATKRGETDTTEVYIGAMSDLDLITREVLSGCQKEEKTLRKAPEKAGNTSSL